MAAKKEGEPEVDQSAIEIEDIFDEENSVAAGAFFKFTKIGDKISGELIEVEDQPAKDDFREQRIYTLKTKDDNIWKVGIGLHKKYVIDRASRAALGDILGFHYAGDYQTPENKKKGKAPSKEIEVYLQKKAKSLEDF